MARTHLAHCNTKSTTFTNSKPILTRKPLRYMPKIVAISRNESYWASIESDVESYLKKAIPIRSPETVFEPMHYLTFSAPKTTASALCMAACEFMGGNRNQAITAASAIHLMHAAAYTHENLISTDRLRLKHDDPSVKDGFGPNIELLTGDGIIPFGLELLARSMDLARANQDRILRVIIEITRATGSQGVVDGQYHELGLDRLDSLELETIEYVCKKKEGELHACGAACGAILGGGNEVEIEKLRKFGLYVGMVQGMVAKNNPRLEDKIEDLKEMAFKELDSFKGDKLELISSIIEPSLSIV